MKIVTITGNRPQKLGLPYDLRKREWDWTRQQLERALVDELHADKLLTGMALGADQLGAEVASRNGIPYIAAIPFEGQESRWPKIAQERYHDLLAIADEQIVVSEGAYAPWKMQSRNEWMVEYSEELVAVWNGSPGGTANCVKYAQEKGKRIWRIDPTRQKAGFFN